MSVRIAGVGQGSEPKNMIVGFPSTKHKMELTAATESSGNTTASHKISWNDISVYMRMTVSANNEGTSQTGIMQIDTTDYYDLTAYSKLCVAAKHTCGEHTGHAWRIYVVDEAGKETAIYKGNNNGFDTPEIDISAYKGKHKIRLRTYTGYATYGYGESTTEIKLSTLALMK